MTWYKVTASGEWPRHGNDTKEEHDLYEAALRAANVAADTPLEALTKFFAAVKLEPGYKYTEFRVADRDTPPVTIE